MAGVITFILVTIASDIGGYAAGVLFGKHPMAPVISPEEVLGGLRRLGRLPAMVAGWPCVVHLLDGDWWVGVPSGLSRS